MSKYYEHLVLRFSPVYAKSNANEYVPLMDDLVAKMQDALNKKQEEGWKVVGLSNVLAGNLDTSPEQSYGYSTTAAIIVVLRREVGG